MFVVARADESLPFDGPPLIDGEDFTVTTFAASLNFPSGLAALPDGSLLVATSRPDGGGYFSSVGELLRFIDADQDGYADGPAEILATGLPGELVNLERSGNLVFVITATWDREGILFFHLGANPADSLLYLGQIAFSFGEVYHQAYGLVSRPSPDKAGATDLFFTIGAYANDASGLPVEVTGLTNGTLDDAAVYEVTIEERGGSVEVSEPLRVATGLRNAMGMAIDTATGDLLLADNGINGLQNLRSPLSADEIDRIPIDQIGGEPEQFGFPDSYTDYATGTPVGETGIAPEIVFLRRDGSESVGASSMAFAPAGFPDHLDRGVFVGFHGPLDETGLANPKNPLIFVDLETGERVEVVSNDAPNVGHLNSLLATDDALFIADLCANGSIGEVTPCGVVYRVAPRV